MKFVLTADWHLRGDTPRCRVESNWVEKQLEVVRFIVSVANKENCPLMICGDIFHTPRAATEIVNGVIAALKLCAGGVWILAGNHDLPYHSVENIDRSSIKTLLHFFNDLTTHPEIDAQHFGQDATTGKRIAFVHRLIMPDSHLATLSGSTSIEGITQEFPDAEFICCGDYHHAFVEDVKRPDGRFCTVINPGCVTVQTADMVGYKPSVYLFDDDDGVQPVEIDIAAEFATEYLTEEKERDARASAFFDAFIKQKATLSFRDNLERRLRTDDLSQGCRDVVEDVISIVYKKS